MPMDYVKYISSASWRNNPVRLREFEAAGFQCRLCPNCVAEGYTLEGHHRTYERLGCEIDGDVTALCHECHIGVTSMLRARRYCSQAIEPRDFVPPIPNPEPLFDPDVTGVST
jgi:hypothetical protein